MVTKRQGKTVVLDLGNVVLDWNVECILKSLDLEPEELDLLRGELFAHQDWIDLDHGKTSEKAVVSRISKRSTLSEQTVWNALSAARNSLAPIENTLSLMQEISTAGIEMFCLSNMSRETYSHIKDKTLFEMFNGIIISGIEGCMKPNEDIFHLTIERFALQPADTLFVDDSLPNIITAQRLGINGHHFKRSQDCYGEIRDFLFADSATSD